MTAEMTVKVGLVNSKDDTRLGEFEFAAVPQVGSEVMVLNREWEIWGVEGGRYWPRSDTLRRPAQIVAYVRYHGDLEIDG